MKILPRDPERPDLAPNISCTNPMAPSWFTAHWVSCTGLQCLDSVREAMDWELRCGKPGMTDSVVTHVRAKVQSLISGLSECRRLNPIPVRCLMPLDLGSNAGNDDSVSDGQLHPVDLTFDEYNALLGALSSASATLDRFEGLREAVGSEQSLLSLTKERTIAACSVPSGGPKVPPDSFLKSNGCNMFNAPRAEVASLKAAYVSAWQATHPSTTREAAEFRATVIAGVKSSKASSTECQYINTATTYCGLKSDQERAKADLAAMSRLDRRSGTADPSRRRAIVARQMQAEEGLRQADTAIAKLGRSRPANTECATLAATIRKARQFACEISNSEQAELDQLLASAEDSHVGKDVGSQVAPAGKFVTQVDPRQSTPATLQLNDDYTFVLTANSCERMTHIKGRFAVARNVLVLSAGTMDSTEYDYVPSVFAFRIDGPKSITYLGRTVQCGPNAGDVLMRK